MGKATWLALGLSLMVACVEPGAVQCGDGRTCPADTTCDDTRSLCLTQAQTTACDGIQDGKPCNAAGTPGICDRGYCEPGCGDGHTDPNEECDDGNFASHDGCSSQCRVEVPAWSELKPDWQGITYAGGVYHEALGRIVVFGGFDSVGATDKIWQIDPARVGELDGGWHNVTSAFAPADRPSARRAFGVAYDRSRGVMVIYGGDSTGPPLNETWEYAAGGTTFEGDPIGVWHQSTSATTPPPMFAPAMAYDANLKKVVLYGFGTETTETWLYDGQWSQVVTTTHPSPNAQMAFDETRQVLVLVTGSGFVYEFSGTDWVLKPLSPRPPPRNRAMLAYHPRLAKLVLFGGQTATGVLSDTWTYDGAAWQQLVFSASPPGRRSARLVSDPVNACTWLFGGTTVDGADPFEDEWQLDRGPNTTDPIVWTDHTPRFGPPRALMASGAYSRDDHSLLVLGDDNGQGISPGFEVWSHDGRTWRQEPNAPVDRFGVGLAYDPVGRRFVMSGGACGPYDVTGDCDVMELPTTSYAFSIDSRSWTQVPAVLAYSQTRDSAGFVYDGAAQRFVAFGGESADGATITPARDDTLATDLTTWTPIDSPERPAATRTPGLSFDPGRGSTILFDAVGDTWELKGNVWTKLIDHTQGPPARTDAGFTYDPSRKRHVLAAGFAASDGHPLADVWELDAETLTWTQLFVPGATPLPRHNFVLAPHDQLRGVVLYGGAAGALFSRNDVWLLKYVSITPDEDCSGTADADGDGQLPADDPDCTVR